MQDVLISVVICTFNRAPYLSKALHSLSVQTLPPENFEVLVVDNASTDNTKQIVVEDYAHMRNLKYLYEAIQGANQARNTGRREARAEYVAYMDDDVIVSPQWLETVLEIFAQAEPQPGGLGGKIEPIWESPRPVWLADDMLRFLAMLDLSDAPIILNDKQWLMSANIAFPKRALEEVNGFDVHMGRVGNKLLSMDENFLQQRLRDRGYQLLYHPKMAVRHHIPTGRLSKKWFLRRMYWEGVSLAVAQIHADPPTMARRLRMALYTARQLLLSPGRLINLALPTDDPGRFEHKCLVLEQVGYMMGSLGVSK